MRKLFSLCFKSIAFIGIAYLTTIYLQKAFEFGDVVVIANNGNRPISNIVLRFQGGQCSLDQIPQKNKRSLLVNVAGASDLFLTFKDSSGKQHKTPIDIYIEPFWQGSVNIQIGDNGETKFQNWMRPF